MKCSIGISNFLEEISSLSNSVVLLYFFALIAEEGFLISPGYSLDLCIQMGISFLFSFAFCFISHLFVTTEWQPQNPLKTVKSDHTPPVLRALQWCPMCLSIKKDFIWSWKALHNWDTVTYLSNFLSWLSPGSLSVVTWAPFESWQ